MIMERKEVFPMRLFPKEENFFELFDELANKIEEGGKLFLDMAQARDYSDVRVSKLKEIEHEADGITHKTYEKMHKTFLTPIDREDIYALVNKMDSIMDVIEATAVRIHLYKVKRTSDEIIKQAQILNDAIQKLKTIILAMRDMKNSEMILAGCVEINTLENAGDVTLRTIMANLFENERDAIELIKWKDIFQLLEEAIDVCEDVSNIVEGIVLKHA
jgi:predicted phosphate transport protein (TIGR00153 family)